MTNFLRMPCLRMKRMALDAHSHASTYEQQAFLQVLEELPEVQLRLTFARCLRPGAGGRDRPITLGSLPAAPVHRSLSTPIQAR